MTTNRSLKKSRETETDYCSHTRSKQRSRESTSFVSTLSPTSRGEEKRNYAFVVFELPAAQAANLPQGPLGVVVSLRQRVTHTEQQRAPILSNKNTVSAFMYLEGRPRKAGKLPNSKVGS